MINYFKNTEKKELLMKILLFFVIIQPLLDIYILFDEKIITLFHFSPSTILRMIIIIMIGILTFITYHKKKHLIWYVTYGALISIYIILHHLTAIQFKSNFPDNFNYSFISELFYIIRMMIPLIVIYISSKLKYSNNRLYKIVFWLTILISGSIVITNFLGISLGTYTSKFTEVNFFSWFFSSTYYDYTFYDAATKSLFMYGNQVSSLLLFLNILVLYIVLIKPTVKNVLLLILNFLAMFILGTKVATLGFIISLFTVLIVYLFCYFIDKEKNKINKNVIIIFTFFAIFWAIIYPYSPCNNRSQLTTTIASTHDYDSEKHTLSTAKEKIESMENSTEKIEYMKKFVKENWDLYAIEKATIFKKYNYKYDPEFWYNTFCYPYELRASQRFLEEAILKRMIEVNDKQIENSLFGITYTRMSNAYPLERDFLSHYYTLGIIGFILLLSPYFIIFGFLIIYILRDFKNRCTLINICSCLSIFVLLGSAFYSGNVMDSLFVTIIFGFFIGQYIVFLKNTRN